MTDAFSASDRIDVDIRKVPIGQYFLMCYDKGCCLRWRETEDAVPIVIDQFGTLLYLSSKLGRWADPNTIIEPIDPETCAAIDMLRVHGCTQRIRDLVGDPWRGMGS